jgi:tartrate dehydrogenase/decarboxylase/D-malate dehydrogenase
VTRPNPVRVALIPGDGVGREVVAVAQDLLRQTLNGIGVPLETTEFGWGSEHYRAHGRAMPEDAAATLHDYDGILFGSLGAPDLPDSDVVWSLIELRKQLDLAANVRPVLRWAGVPTPFSTSAQADFVVVRENTEGEYSGVGGRSRVTSVGDVAIAVSVHSETTIASLARYSFALAQTRRGLLTLISKANAIHHAFSLWEEVVGRIASDFPDVRYEVCLVDAAAARMIQHPESFDVLLTSNLFGDVLSEIGSTLQGGLGMAASANVPTIAEGPGLFEPIHGSAPDIAGRGIANPTGAVLSAAMLLDHLGYTEAGDQLRTATQRAATSSVRTADLGGTASTTEFAATIAAHLANPQSNGPASSLAASADASSGRA